MKWSFSRLEAFCRCKMMYRLSYLENAERDGNAFSDFGNLCHGLLERWATGEMSHAALAEAYEAQYDDCVTHAFPPFPRDMPQKYYEQGLRYFQHFHGFGDQYEILSAEEKFEIRIGDYDLVGIADLVMRNLETGGLVVYDHKTKSASSMRREKEMFRRQLYLYALHVKDKYGVFPEEIAFNMIREGEIYREKFDMEKLKETERWVIDTIHEIETCQSFDPSESRFFCRYVCSVFDSCPLREKILYGQ